MKFKTFEDFSWVYQFVLRTLPGFTKIVDQLETELCQDCRSPRTQYRVEDPIEDQSSIDNHDDNDRHLCWLRPSDHGLI